MGLKLGYIYAGKILGDMNLGTDPYSLVPASLTIEGDLTVEGDFTFGDAVVDTLIVNGRIATGSIAGTELDIDATYTYTQLSEIRASISDWSGVGTSFTGRYERYMASVDSAGMTLRGSEMYLANGDTFDLENMLGPLFNLMGKGNSTIALMRGAEIKLEWLGTDTITNAVGLVIDFAGLAAPTNTIFGIYFEHESAVGAMIPYFQEIRMQEGVTIISRTADPNGVVTAPLGSLCLVTSGTGGADRLWVNTNSGTTWTNITCAA